MVSAVVSPWDRYMKMVQIMAPFHHWSGIRHGPVPCLRPHPFVESGPSIVNVAIVAR